MQEPVKKYNKKHNTLLHIELNTQPKESSTSVTNDADSTSSLASVNHTMPKTGCHVLLSTAVVYVQDAKGNTHSCRALLDNGSQSNFVTEALVKRLGLRRVSTCIPINGVGESTAETHSTARLKIKLRLNNFSAEINCLVLQKITQDIPAVSINRGDVRVPLGITLADPNFIDSAEIDMLIGVEVFWDIMCVGQIKSTETQPCWQKTHFGWIAAGRVFARTSPRNATMCNLNVNQELNDALRRFWEIEHGARKVKINQEERKCEEYFEATARRNFTGRFIVKLPIKQEEMSRLGQSKDGAIRRFRHLERRLERDPSLKTEYAEFMREYESLGHMRELQTSDSSTMPHYYMPHHCVVKEQNSTTRLRVVFDASCKTTSGVSLNNALMVGPVLQQELFSIITRFRTFKYALIADIAKMYRQVLVDESQTSLQRIIWRNDASEQMKEFELLTLTYGTSPASFLAIKSLRTLAEIETKNFPVGSSIVLRDFYVDDLITGANSKTEALKILEETTSLLEKGGFKLRKWASNNPELLKKAPESSIANSIRSLDKEGVFRTLGIQWNPNEDVFQYSMATEYTSTQRTTKRSILSCIAQVFDPLGLLGPVVLLAKLLMQRLWMLQVDWNESLSLDLHTEWINYKSQMRKLNELRIPRRAVDANTISRIELHGFCDASQKAYGACVYLRVTDQEGAHVYYARSQG